MKKRGILGVVLVVVMLFMLAVTPAMAASPEADLASAALWHMNLFQGTGTAANGAPIFELDRAPSRAEALTMLVRLIGKDADAKNGTWEHPFTDVPAWADAYVGYAYENGLTTGTSATTFGSLTNVGVSEYLTFVLRALGYESGVDFKWNAAWELTDKIGFTHDDYTATTASFTRGDVAVISHRALDAKMKAGDKTLFEVLEAAKVFNAKDYTIFGWALASCYSDTIDLVFETADYSRSMYEKFEVVSATVNGVEAKITNYDKSYMDKIFEGNDFVRGGICCFAGVSLEYDGDAVYKATTEYYEEDGYKYPVYTYELKVDCLGADGNSYVEEVTIHYYMDGFGGPSISELAY